MINMSYKKRSGTSGLHGQLYETKLLSLLNFRAKHDNHIEEFYLGTNVDLIGEMDDICFRAKVKDLDKPIAVFIQTKHRDTDKVMTFNVKNDLVKYFASYLKIKESFGTRNEDKLFEGTFSGTECLFVMYTNAKYEFENNLIETEYTTKLKDLIGTSETGCYKQPPTYETKDVEFLGKIIVEEQVSTLAEYFGKSLDKEVSMTNELVSSYHYILAQTVFDVSDIQPEGHRIASFRKDFFDTNEHFVLIFKRTFYENVLLKRKFDMPQILNLLEKIFKKPVEVEVLSELIGTVITYKNGKFEFIKTMREDLKRQLNKVNVLQATVDEAFRKILEPFSFKVPSAFGNKDLTIRGNEKKVEKRLKHLTSKIVDLINDGRPNTIITIEDSLEPGLLQVNGGLAGAVGNVFVPDEHSKLMKFAENIESLKGDIAKRLYLKLQIQISHDLQDYKFNVRVKNFTKLSFDSGEHDENLVREFLSRMIFYTNQSHEKGIGDILEREMVDQPYAGIQHFRVKAHAIFLKYHDEIQEWWMKFDTADYLTKDNKYFEKSLEDTINQPLISVINMMHKFKMQKLEYTFSAAAIRSLELDEQYKTNVIVTNNCLCTVAKLTQYLNNKNHVVLHLEYIEDLPVNDYKTLCTELSEYKGTVIFVNVGNRYERIKNIVKAVQTQLFIITDEKALDVISSYFSSSSPVFRAYDNANNLINLSKYSQETFLKNTKVKFQDVEVSLDFLVNDKDTIKFIEGNIFHKMLQKEIIEIGMPVGNQNYDELKHLYVDRRVSRIRKSEKDAFLEVKDELIQTLYDLKDNVVLVTAIPGMGKSTLLSHLSFKTKEIDPKVWIIRINLLEYSQIFKMWQKDKTAIDLIPSLYFMCCIALGVTEIDITAKLQTENNVVSLKHCSGDASTTLGLKMFLQFYNNGTLIFLFDGFDEIFPHYADEALSLLKSVRSYPRHHKIWITSRSYNDIKDILEHEFGRSYEIEHFSDVEQETFLRKYWKSNICLQQTGKEPVPGILKHFDVADMYGNLYSCFRNEANQFVQTQYGIQELPYYKVCLVFGDFLKTEFGGCTPDHSFYLANSSTYIKDFVAPPLHLYLLADYMSTEMLFQNEVNCCSIRLYTHDLYRHFVEVKLKIRFQEKNKIDMSNPDNIQTYERERADFLTKHSKLGAYAIFYPYKDSVFSENDLKKVEETIDKLRLGKEKTGLIHSVAGNIPLFIHKVFAEYFAVEYINDLWNSDVTGTRELILRLSDKCKVLFWLRKKLKVDCSQ